MKMYDYLVLKVPGTDTNLLDKPVIEMMHITFVS